MRSLLTLLAFLTIPFALHAQDDAALAAQQQNLIVQQQVQQQQDQITQQQIQQQQQNLVNQANASSYSHTLREPSIEVQAGPTAGTVALRIRNNARGAEVFYTTDGWTPTPASSLYTGPVTLRRTTRVQAIAFSPGAGQSSVAGRMVLVTAPGAVAAGGPVEFPELRVGTTLPLEFSAQVRQNDLQVGDRLPVVLAQDLVVGGKLVAPKGSAVLATVTHNDKRGFAGQPGELSFTVHSVTLADGYVLPLEGGRTMQGTPHTGKAAAFAVIPLAGIAGMLVHGGGAVIPRAPRSTRRWRPQPCRSPSSACGESVFSRPVRNRPPAGSTCPKMTTYVRFRALVRMEPA